jgi:hypothetical protein
MKQRATILAIALIVLALSVLVLAPLIYALPVAPSIDYISNSTAAGSLTNRSMDAKGTITTLNLSANQQNFKWKAYVGNVTGTVALDDANGQTIYDWNLATAGGGGGEVYVSRSSGINWATIACASDAAVINEQNALGLATNTIDSINLTINRTTHASFIASTTNLSGCRSTATYVNDSAQAMSATALFQEVLLMDAGNTSHIVYATLMQSATTGYNNNHLFNFQLIVAENESATVPTNYYFWVELG